MKKMIFLVLSISVLSVSGCATKVMDEPKPCACGEMKDVNKHYIQSIS